MFIRFLFTMLVVCVSVTAFSQGRLSIENVHADYLHNSGTIMQSNQIKGYFFLYESDKIDKRTNEYTLQILDQNVNKVIDIKFEDTKQLSLLEASYNNSSLAFLFRNDGNKTLDLKIYDVQGNLKFTYSRKFDKLAPDNASGGSNRIFDLGDKGYASVNVVSGRYEVNYYSSESKKVWTYTPSADEKNISNTAFLGSTDSLILLRVTESEGGIVVPHIIAVNFVTGQKAFQIEGERDGFMLMPSNAIDMKAERKILLAGNYYQKDDHIMSGNSKGIAAYEISREGRILTTTFNSWPDDYPANVPGNINIHKLIQSNDKLFVVGEVSKSKAGTDLVTMELNNRYKIINVNVFNETDFKFTAGDIDNSSFSVCYTDYMKSAEFKGQTINSIRYNGEKFVKDRIKLRSKANRIQVLPAKMGSVMIVEYFRKSKKLQFRIEKMG